MNLVQLGAISTGVVIALGYTMIVPVFFHAQRPVPSLTVMLSFVITEDEGAQDWCRDLAYTLERHRINATVFIAGRVAEQHPDCVTGFSARIDIGSQTYTYVDLTSIPDYSLQLQEVRKGKLAVDHAGEFYSRLFRAPYGSTDGNIYSLLSRSDIVADFSHDRQYNKYDGKGKFLRFDLKVYDGADHEPEFFTTIPITEEPIMILFDKSLSIEKIGEFISQLKLSGIRLVSASDLTGVDLTVREGEHV